MYEALHRAVLPWLRPDRFAEHDPCSQYTVRSIYFDTPRLHAYHEKVEGVSARTKLRIRGYDTCSAGGSAFLEIKRRVDQLGGKDRTAVSVADLPSLFDALYAGPAGFERRWGQVQGEGIRRFWYHILRQSMVPVILVTYDREAYQGRFEQNLRITFDKAIRYRPFPGAAELYTEEGMRPLSRAYLIMEVKFDRGFPRWLRHALEESDVVRRSFSKYAACVEACHALRPLAPRLVRHRPRVQCPQGLEVAA